MRGSASDNYAKTLNLSYLDQKEVVFGYVGRQPASQSLLRGCFVSSAGAVAHSQPVIGSQRRLGQQLTGYGGMVPRRFAEISRCNPASGAGMTLLCGPRRKFEGHKVAVVPRYGPVITARTYRDKVKIPTWDS